MAGTMKPEIVQLLRGSQEQPGPYVQGWFGRLMIKARQGTLQLVSATATTVVMAEVRKFLGLPPA
jgi:hypothetical protein